MLFAAYHVLLRRLVPWHPPCALVRLILLRMTFVIVDPETNCLILFPVNCYLILQLVFKDFFSSFFLCAVVKVHAESLPLRDEP